MLCWISTCLLASLLLPNGECSKIIGGREAAPHSRPYMALLNTNGYQCSGTLIKDDWVLTAAHCKVNSSTTIKLGVHSIKDKNKYIQNFKLLRSIRYNYDEDTLDNDIELVQLCRKAELNKAVNILPLPKKFDDVKDGTLCNTAGWGSTNKNNFQPSDKLMEVCLPAISRKKCAEMWDYDQITPNMMCTLDASGKKDACVGDSGGPLICKKMFRGIVSFGPTNPCANPKIPAVYTFLTKDYIKWINKEINKNTNTIN